jgi:hypothetical protein
MLKKLNASLAKSIYKNKHFISITWPNLPNNKLKQTLYFAQLAKSAFAQIFNIFFFNSQNLCPSCQCLVWTKNVFEKLILFLLLCALCDLVLVVRPSLYSHKCSLGSHNSLMEWTFPFSTLRKNAFFRLFPISLDTKVTKVEIQQMKDTQKCVSIE